MTKQKDARDFAKDVTVTGCGCVWCDVGNKAIRHNPPGQNYHVTARGKFTCTRTQ